MKPPVVKSLTWYDTETSGINHNYDQVYQAAVVKTDADLNIIEGSAEELLCKPRIDVVPHPMAFLTHMLDINALKGPNVLNELQLAQALSNKFLSNDNNFIAGYNSESFDDEVVRRLFYRNMLDPYAHEWRDGNGRFDTYKMVQLVYALKPEMLQWRKNDKGNDSLKLEHLVEDNNLGSHLAHDALSDVYATIALTKHIKESNPKLFSYMLSLSRKDNVSSLLFNSAKIEDRSPILNISTIYGKDKRYSSVVLPMLTDMSNKNKVLCIDLTQDPYELLNMSSDEINKFMFTKREELQDGDPIVPACGIQVNKLPVALKFGNNTLTGQQMDRMDIDIDAINNNRETILNAINSDPNFIKRFQAGFCSKLNNKDLDAYASIYDGTFISNKDKGIRFSMLQSKSDTDETMKLKGIDVHGEALKTENKEKQFNLLLRAKWTNFGSSILSEGNGSPSEFIKWFDFIEKSLFDDNYGLSIHSFHQEALKARTEMALTSEQVKVLDDLVDYVNELELKHQKLRDFKIGMEKVALEETTQNKNIERYNRMHVESEDFTP